MKRERKKQRHTGLVLREKQPLRMWHLSLPKSRKATSAQIATFI
jgi:hypothetical protein